MPIKAKRNKMNFIDMPSYERKRIAGKKKVNEFKDGFLILISIIKLFIINKWKIFFIFVYRYGRNFNLNN